MLRLLLPIAFLSLAALPAQLPATDLDFIDTSFENASPLWYEADTAGVIHLHLNYDHERSSPNRAAGHIHFQLQAKAGTKLTLEFHNLDNVYNGRKGSVARELKALVLSVDGKDWTPAKTRSLPGDRVQLDVTMPGPKLFVARVEPYRLSDLDRMLARIRKHPQVAVTAIGKTVEGRDLEMVCAGDPKAPYRVFLRARAHPWEAGGNWVVQGLLDRLLEEDKEAKQFRQRYCTYILPMANKDGVARGRTRFNSRGKDLNRDWDKPADAGYAPENHALEQWLVQKIKDGEAPHLALELHNDGSGLLHISRPPIANLQRHVDRMKVFEGLLRKHTWFTEGSTKETFRGSTTLGNGWLQRYGIDAAVHEFNCHWIAGLKTHPTGREWRQYGAGLGKVFFEYFGAVKP